MFIIEFQYNGEESTPGLLWNFYTDRSAAEQDYHTKLSYAAVSSVRAHTISMVNEHGEVIKTETYYH